MSSEKVTVVNYKRRVAELEAEVVRLREELRQAQDSATGYRKASEEWRRRATAESDRHTQARELAEHRGKSLVKQLDATLAETRAHEATKAERNGVGVYMERDALRAQVAELERKNDGLGRAKDVFASRAYLAEDRVTELERNCDHYRQWRKAVASLQQARALIAETERACFGDSAWRRRLQDWLAANPAPATPAAARDARLQAQGFEPVSEEQREQNRLVNLGQVTPAATGVNRLQELEAKIARVQALIDDSVDARHGPGGCGIYACSLREALK